MGIQIKGSNDTISSGDGSIVLEGATLTFTNENISGISTMASAEVTGNLSIADKIIHTGDTNTMIRFPAADTITVETAGSERIRIDDNGRIGIGTLSPYSNSLLHCDGNLVLTASGNAPKIIFDEFGTGTDPKAQIEMDQTDSTNAALKFYTEGSGTLTERLRITSAGLIGIGSAIPAEKLDVYGTIQCLNELRSKTGNDLLLNAGSANRDVKIQVNDVNMLYVKGDTGFIGAGTASPRRHLHIHNSATATVGFQMTNGNTGEANDSQGFQLKVGSDSHAEISQMENSYLSVYTNTSERLRIGSTGTVRIGGSLSSSHQCDLDVVRANSTLTDVMLIKGDVGNGFIRFQDSDNTSNWTMGVDDGAGIGDNGFVWYDRVNSTYRLSVDNGGHLKVWSGNIQMASGQGIDFSATGGPDTGASGSSELLDDYEEGSWSGVVMDGNGTNITINNVVAKYVKVGQLVYCYFNITRNETSSRTGSVTFYQLPFTSANSTLQITGTWWLDEGGTASGDSVGGSMYVIQNTNQASFVHATSPGQQATNRYLQYSEWSQHRPIYGSFTYQTPD